MSAPAIAPRLGWWDVRALGWHCCQPLELVAHAQQHMPADCWLDTPEALERVAHSYIAHSRKAGRFDCGTMFTPSTYSGYRARLREYRDTLAAYLRKGGER